MYSATHRALVWANVYQSTKEVGNVSFINICVLILNMYRLLTISVVWKSVEPVRDVIIRQQGKRKTKHRLMYMQLVSKLII